MDHRHVAVPFFQSLSFPSTARTRLEMKLERYKTVLMCTKLLSQLHSSLTDSHQLPALTSFCNTKRKSIQIAICAFGKCTGCDSCYLCFTFHTASPSVLNIWPHIVHIPVTKAAFSCFKSLHLDGSQVDISSETLIEMLSLTPNLELKSLELHYALATKSSRSGYLDVAVLCRCLEMRQANGYTLASLLVHRIHKLTTLSALALGDRQSK